MGGAGGRSRGRGPEGAGKTAAPQGGDHANQIALEKKLAGAFEESWLSWFLLSRPHANSMEICSLKRHSFRKKSKLRVRPLLEMYPGAQENKSSSKL